MSEDAEENPLESLMQCLAFDSRDWSVDKNDAWIYGIVWGWGDSTEEVAERHRWEPETVKRLGRLRSAFVALLLSE